MNGPRALTVKRVIRARREDLFYAWITPRILTRWWGPKCAHCPSAEIDARPGGAYRIANAFEDGRFVWITGHFETVNRPELLVFSWSIDGDESEPERVTVLFRAIDDGASTEITVTHERIPSQAVLAEHERGWNQCLTGLGRLSDQWPDADEKT